MGKIRNTNQPQNAQLTPEEIKAAIPKLERRISDLESFDLNSIHERWDPKIEALQNKVNSTLKEIFYNTVEYNVYYIDDICELPLFMGGAHSLTQVIEGCRKGIDHAVIKLKTLKELFLERLQDLGAITSAPSLDAPKQPVTSTQRVFVVYGRDEAAKETVARFLSKLNLDPIVLHEQSNQGRTIIEKFEAHSAVDYAVVLFSPDDIAYPANQPDQQQYRARQNVILELGFFLGKLGRERACVLIKGDVEIPSDFHGVLYVPLDDNGAWRFKLAGEMKNAGIDLDLNKAI